MNGIASTLVTFAIVVAIVIYSMKRKQAMGRKALKRVQADQAKRHAEIINDSLRIIDTTRNIETLRSRVGVALSNIAQMEALESQGVSITERPISNTKIGLMEFANEKISAMAEELYKMTAAKHGSYSSPKTANNAIEKAQLKLVEYRESLYPEVMNSDKYNGVINGYYDDLSKMKQ